MTLWIVWSILVSGLLALAAAAVERAAAYLNAPRRFVWIGAMALAAVAPVAFALRYQPVVPTPVVTPRAAPRGLDRAQQDEVGGDALLLSSTATVPSSATTASLRQRIVSAMPAVIDAIDPWVVRMWLAASSMLLIVFGRELLRLRRERSRWREAEVDSCSALVAADAGPAVVGFAHPRIVVPEWTLALDRNARSLLLRHETEHIRAGDPRMLLGGLLLLIALPWNAALWWMARQLRLAIEIDCDARVIRAVGATRDYGMVLLAVSERFVKPLPFAASLAAPRLTLERRINAMSAPRQRRPLLAALPFGLVALVAITVAARTPRPAPLATVNGMAAPKMSARLSPTGAPTASFQRLTPTVASAVPVASAVVLGQAPSTAQACAVSAPPVDSSEGVAVGPIYISRKPDGGQLITTADGTPVTMPLMKVDTVNTNSFGHVESQRDAQGLVHGFVILVRGSDGWNVRPVIRRSLGLDEGVAGAAGSFLPEAARTNGVAGGRGGGPGAATGTDFRDPPAPDRQILPAFIPGDPVWPGLDQEHRGSPGRGGFVFNFRNFTYEIDYSFQTNLVNYEYGDQTVSLADGNVLLLSNVDGVAGPPTLTVAGCIPITPSANMVARALALVRAARTFVR